MSGCTITCPSLSKVTHSSPVHQNHQTFDEPCRQHCEEANSPHSRMYQAFPSLLPCNDDLHSDFRTRGLFGRNWFEFLSAEYLRPRARTTHRICLHFSSVPFCVGRKRERRAQEPCTTNFHCSTALRGAQTTLTFVVVREQIDKQPECSRSLTNTQRLCTDAKQRQGTCQFSWACTSGINCPFHASATCFDKLEEQVISITGHANRCKNGHSLQTRFLFSFTS